MIGPALERITFFIREVIKVIGADQAFFGMVQNRLFDLQWDGRFQDGQAGPTGAAKVMECPMVEIVWPLDFGKRLAFRFVVTPVIPGLVKKPIFGGG